MPKIDPSVLVEPWGASVHEVDLGGHTHFVQWDGPPEPAPIVLVHGLGGSHLNWMPLGKLLASHRRVYALDLAGFGLTEPGTRQTSVEANARLVSDFVSTVVGRSTYLTGNSMGGLISTMVANQCPELIRGAILLNPALPITTKNANPKSAAMFLAMMTPGVGEVTMRRLTRRVSPHRQVERTMNMVMPGVTLDETLFSASVDLAAHRRSMGHSDKSFLSAARSIMRRGIRPKTAYRYMGGMRCPVLLVHGEKDAIVPVTAARRAAERYTHWKYVELESVGHVPMIECPDVTAHLIEQFIAETERAVADRAKSA